MMFSSSLPRLGLRILSYFYSRLISQVEFGLELVPPLVCIWFYNQAMNIIFFKILTGQPWIYVQTGEQEAGEQPCGKGSGGPGCWQVKYESAVCLGSQRGQLYPRVCQAQHCCLCEGRDCTALFCAVQAWVPQLVEGHKNY